MFNAVKRSRRGSDSSLSSLPSLTLRRRRLRSDGTTTTSAATNGPLEGLVVCLTGLTVAEKTKLHSIVEQLGGTYARDLDTSQTTHLIAQTPEGAKYETAISCSRISVVSPDWLLACYKDGKRVLETEYTITSKETSQTIDDHPPLSEVFDQVLKPEERNQLFYHCRFLFLGFDQSDVKDICLLERLIQRGRGTIYSEINEIITHLLVKDGSDQVLIDAATTVSINHPMGPLVVSPRWALESWKAKELLSGAKFRPLKSTKVAVKKVQEEPPKKPRKRTSSIFRGSLFSLVRLSPPPGAVDYDAAQLTTEITSNGGQMMSAKILEALRTDQRKAEASRRTCYIVFWGGYTKAYISIHTLLSQLQKEDLCTLVPVSVVWLRTAIVDKKLPTAVSRKPMLFQPQPWPLRLLPTHLKLALTGFVHSERTAIIQLIRAVGASYTENMKPSNTHLICRNSTGPKYEKAIEWKLFAVSIEWLYHVVRYGYGGEKGTEKSGCESQFSLVPTDPPLATTTSEQKEDKEDDKSMSQEVVETQSRN